MLQIAVCDDDANFLISFKPLSHQIFSKAQQAVALSAFDDGRALIEAVEKQGRLFDVIFLYVDMPAIDDLQTADRLRKVELHINRKGHMLLLENSCAAESKVKNLFPQK